MGTKYSPPHKILFAIVILYSLISFIFYFFNEEIVPQDLTNPFFFQSTDIAFQLRESIISDGGYVSVAITRFLHNKILSAVDIFFHNIYMLLDVVYIFSLNDGKSFNGPYYPIRFLYPYEFFLFVVALIYVIKHIKYIWIHYKYSIVLLIISVIAVGLFNTTFYRLSIIPLAFSIRLFIAISLFELLKGKRIWLRK